MNKNKLETALWIFCIFVLVALTAKVYIENSQYDCEKCVVELSTKMAQAEGYMPAKELKIKDLFEAYVYDGKCEIVWSPTQGYMSG